MPGGEWAGGEPQIQRGGRSQCRPPPAKPTDHLLIENECTSAGRHEDFLRPSKPSKASIRGRPSIAHARLRDPQAQGWRRNRGMEEEEGVPPEGDPQQRQMPATQPDPQPQPEPSAAAAGQAEQGLQHPEAAAASASPMPSAAQPSAPFVQAAAPSPRLVDRLRRLDSSVVPEAARAPPRAYRPGQEPVAEPARGAPQPHSNVTYIVSKPEGSADGAAASSAPPLLLAAGLGLLISASLAPFVEAWSDAGAAMVALEGFGNRSALHVPLPSDKWREYERTEHSLIAWHNGLEATQRTCAAVPSR